MAYEGITQAKQIGRRLGDLRRSAGLSVEDASERTGAKAGTIRSHEKGARYPRPNVIAKYARAYGVDPAAILVGSEVSRPATNPDDVLHALRLTTSCLEFHKWNGGKVDQAVLEFARAVLCRVEKV